MSFRERENMRGGLRAAGFQARRVGSRERAKDWRDNFYSVFIGNLSSNVSNTSLWQAFSLYGKVRDVYIDRKSQRNITFAFVRFGFESEAWSAINRGNLRLIDGRAIRVCIAFNRKLQKSGLAHKRPAEDSTVVKETDLAKEGKSYSRVVDGGNTEKNPQQNTSETREEEAIVHKMKFSSKTTNATLEWLNRSAFGKLNGFNQPRAIQEALSREGISVMVSAYGGLSVIVSFNNREEMEELLKNYDGIFAAWFKSITPWEPSLVSKESFLWLSITGIPLQLWHSEFFRQLGDLWGEYISMDATTERRLYL